MAVCGHNGDNESYIGYSSSIGLSFFDENLNEINVENSSEPFDIVISKDANMPFKPYQYINVSEMNISLESLTLNNGFNILSNNASIHIEIKPVDFSIGYLLVMKLGYTPIVNTNPPDFDSFEIFCPSNVNTKKIKNS